MFIFLLVNKIYDCETLVNYKYQNKKYWSSDEKQYRTGEEASRLHGENAKKQF
jgi:hypothetical protein